MKCQILFSGKNKKNIINLSSAENAQRVVKVCGVRIKLLKPQIITCPDKSQENLLNFYYCLVNEILH